MTPGPTPTDSPGAAQVPAGTESGAVGPDSDSAEGSPDASVTPTGSPAPQAGPGVTPGGTPSLAPVAGGANTPGPTPVPSPGLVPGPDDNDVGAP
eukprot:scaffold219617_cov18-Prasinocladus_malaysianus.AAC.1